MYSKIIFVLATVCIVNASVLTVNVYDDDAETEVKVRPSKCKSKACDFLCRRLNKTNGTCVEGHCKCDKSPIAEDADDMTDPVELLSPGDCNLRACEQLCRRLGFPGGVCVNGRCKCDNFLKTNDAVTELNVDEDSVQPRSCNNKRCNQICRKQKFRGGACVGANCYCNKFLSLQDDADSLTDSVEKISPLSCNSIACDDQCRRNGWHSGVCINGQCKCDYFLYTEDTLTDSEENLSPLSCNSIACDDQCRRTGWHSGVCINGQCKCDYFLYKQDPVTPKRCTPEACSVLCRRLKLGEGVCDGSRCRCSNYKPTPKVVMADLDKSISLDDNFLSDNSLSTKDADDMTDPAESLSPGDCNLRACEQLCRRLGFPGGACVNGRCSCDNFLNSIVDAVEEYLGLATRRVCHVRKCNRTCTRRGYAGARCVNGRCECYDKIERQDTSLQNDVTSAENEETNEILRTKYEEEPIETSRSACNTVFCNQMCHRLKYAGGWCRFGQCQCY